MLLILAERQEDQGIADYLHQAGYQVELVNLNSRRGKISWEGYLGKEGLLGVVDASHPFSPEPSKTVEKICSQRGLVYLRYQEKVGDLPEDPLIYKYHSWEEGAKKAEELGNTIFLTTGSNNLDIFLELCQGKRLVLRVLPDYKVIKKCQDLGFNPKDIVAMQGPFSKELNRSMFKFYKASVVVTRESGKRGGADTKVAAALSLGIPVVVIEKSPAKRLEAGSYEEILVFMREKLRKEQYHVRK